ncbi:hypothetical protein AM500_05010 [Bacillus sp. FJAT-18017]|uniref:hypothetical protein n=1 Tax=Bacillus sp. FJAT-18017 TaxID=1705566 RepID=UPI0006ADFF4F|nr:hypothetical protein [Bacillus sp. FJAT-18017]ALC89215.1 hypothetical protein AM500_05010 [Bacillus sp. FJAT-18017]
MNFDSMNNGNKKSCIIVYGKNGEVYANLLVGLIDEFEEYECTIWSEEKFKQNQDQLSSSNKVIFIGNTKVSQKFIPNLRIKYSKFGMNYGWLGHKCVIYTSHIPIKKDELNAFLDYCKKVSEDIKNISESFSSVKAKALFALPQIINPFIPLLGTIAISFFQSQKKRKAIIEQQYNVVVRNFFINGLKDFMED